MRIYMLNNDSFLAYMTFVSYLCIKINEKTH